MGILDLISSDLRQKKQHEWQQQGEERARAQALYNFAITQNDPILLKTFEKDLKAQGIEISDEEKAGLVLRSLAAGVIKEVETYAPEKGELPPPGRVEPFTNKEGEVGYYTYTPETERIRERTAAAQIGTIEGTLTGQEGTRERRQRLALEERTSREGRRLFAQEMEDAEARLRMEKGVGLGFALPPTEDRWDDQGNQIRYDYKYNEKKNKWELDKDSGRVIKPAITQGDVAAVKKEIARVMGEIRKLDDIDYNESMKMALVEGMKKTDPVLASKISAIETKSEEGKRKLKAVLGSYLDDLRAMGNISDEEWLELVGPETAPQPAPANWGVDESGKVYRMTE